VRNLLEKIGAAKLALMGAVAAALLIGLAFLSMPGSGGPMGYLFTDLEPAQAQAIADKLQGQGVAFQLSPDGTAVLAPQDQLAELRMSLAGDRLGGKIGYEVLDGEQPFGTSASRARLNETRAVEGELVRSIQSLDLVSKARVHIVMPERPLFATEARRATASVTVKTSGRLGNEQVQAIRTLVAGAVPDLSPDAVAVVDQTGALLARAGEAGVAGASGADERQAEVEGRLRQQIESLLEPIVGVGKVRAEVAAVVDRDQTREEASLVDPDRQAIARQVTVESGEKNDEQGAASAPASISAQLPDAGAAPSTPGDRRQGEQNETSEDTTYENSRTTTVKVKTPGEVRRLTVAVMIDPGTAGLPQPQIARLQRLVENAVGADSERGDSVVVEAMKFSAVDLAEQNESFLDNLPTEQIFSVLKLIILCVVALLVLRTLKPLFEQRLAGTAATPALAAAGAPAALLEGAAPTALTADPAADRLMLDQEIALAEIDGKLKASALKRVGDTVTASPHEATAVIRQWMTQ
jgi:flagellar M-ring protein FliF